jgi:polyisoprenoid-binding protein YceI
MRSGRMRRGLIAGGVALVALLVIAGATALLLGSHQAPAPLALSSPAASGSASSLTGDWKVGDGSEAGYRVREQFINQPGPTEAVARTSKISGGLRVQASGSTLQASGLHFTADLAALQSQDKYANYQVYQRDFFIRTIYLQTDQFPKADFTASPVSIPSGIESGPISITVSGKLTVHGVTKSVTTTLQAQRTTSGIEVAGSINTDMRDFGVEVPSISFTQAEPGVVIEYHLVLVHS